MLRLPASAMMFGRLWFEFKQKEWLSAHQYEQLIAFIDTLTHLSVSQSVHQHSQ